MDNLRLLVTPRTAGMRIKAYLDQVSLVLVGRFNPAIFQPAWFALHGMLGQREAEQSEVRLIHKGVSQFKVDQFDLLVLEDRFNVSSLDGHPEHVRDLVISCFSQHLTHTPLQMMGINRAVHFDTGSFEIRDRVGSRLAPKAAWGVWGKEIEASPLEPAEARGGMISVTMRQSVRPDGHRGYVQTKVEPSVQVPHNKGIFVEVNDHFDLRGTAEGVQDAAATVAVLEANWEASLQRSSMIIDQTMALTEECRA